MQQELNVFLSIWVEASFYRRRGYVPQIHALTLHKECEALWLSTLNESTVSPDLVYVETNSGGDAGIISRTSGHTRRDEDN